MNSTKVDNQIDYIREITLFKLPNWECILNSVIFYIGEINEKSEEGNRVGLSHPVLE